MTIAEGLSETPAADIYAAAHSYAKRGWPVIPLHGKDAFTKKGCHGGSTDPKQIDLWWAKTPDANVGICLGSRANLCVLDADGEVGRLTLAALRPPTDTPWGGTGGGGIHVYFTYDERVTNRTKCLRGLDVKSQGGYVVAPPSIHPETKKPYVWINPPGTILAMPEVFIALVEKKKPVFTAPLPPRPLAPGGMTRYGKAALDRCFVELSGIGAGGRDDARNSAAFSLGRLVAGGNVSTDDAVECVTAACARNGLIEDLGEAELRKRCERAVSDGISAGAKGPDPRKDMK